MGSSKTASEGLKADGAAKQLGDVLERVSDAIVALDRNWCYTYVNQHAAQLFGRSPQDLIGKHIWTEFPEGVGQPFHVAYEEALREQRSLAIESYYAPWHRWYENRIFPSADGLSIFFHEVTTKKQLEEAERESSELLRGQNRVLELIAKGEPLQNTLDTLLRIVEEQSPGMLASILLLDHDGVHVRHGAAPSLPMSFMSKVDGEPIGPAAGSCGTAAYRREPVIVEDISIDPLWVKYRTLARNHGLRACWSTPIFDDERRVLGTFALYFRYVGPPDERHRKQIEMGTHTASIAIVKHREREALTAASERLRLAIAAGKIGIWERDLQTNRLAWSSQLKEILGFSAEGEEITFDRFMQSVHPSDRSHLTAALQDAISNKTDYDLEYRVIWPDGSVHWIEGRGKPEYNSSGQPVCMRGVGMDVTARKEAEGSRALLEEQLHQAQKMESVGRLAGGVAHDFNNLLSVIFGYVELCQNDLPADSKARNHIQQIQKAAERGAALTRQLLAFSRRQPVQPTVIDLNTVINNLSGMIMRIVGEHIEVRIIPGPSLGYIKADVGQIDRIVMNLVVNAADAMPQGGKIIIETSNTELHEDYVRSHPSVLPGPHVMLSVTDTGRGMDEATMSQIFEPFFTTKAPGEGTGLGLSMVHGAVEQSEGHITVTSKPGSGTAFNIYFPRVSSPPDAVAVRPSRAQAARQGSQTILLVEDDESLREMTAALLSRGGYHVLQAKNGASALAIAQQPEKIDLVLTDVVMPEMSGIDLASQLKASRPELKLIYMSGYAGNLLERHGVMESDTVLLQKPFTKSDLIAYVHRALQKES